ncbi:hypothetical protein C490_08431 [Natronobacterium gregoryi SP2]|uniref:Uncharacterized protein n=1 Tax=Natronobacterium gregoryi (strain ATCC 43098 / DSM 3393 / CCM 3738 / CIP 104747 / IAM 13177 / JCM 8860 / NBRC 102187 / NCIMB 2189 / SP2) TaxID=797304 RepID=L9Y7Y2_NATGS|nr:hypothetical protein C490_08431 [Natronobacterium gregoryi SP2]
MHRNRSGRDNRDFGVLERRTNVVDLAVLPPLVVLVEGSQFRCLHGRELSSRRHPSGPRTGSHNRHRSENGS